MRKIKEVLCLKAGGTSNRQIARSCGVSRPTVSDYLRRAVEVGLSWPLPDELSDAALEHRLFPPALQLPAQERGIPDWSVVHRELKRKGVTQFLLWQEYRQQHPQGYQYSWLCDHYRLWLGKQDLVMRQDHRAGEKLFVDYEPIAKLQKSSFRRRPESIESTTYRSKKWIPAKNMPE